MPPRIRVGGRHEWIPVVIGQASKGGQFADDALTFATLSVEQLGPQRRHMSGERERARGAAGQMLLVDLGLPVAQIGQESAGLAARFGGRGHDGDERLVMGARHGGIEQSAIRVERTCGFADQVTCRRMVGTGDRVDQRIDIEQAAPRRRGRPDALLKVEDDHRVPRPPLA